jgi:HEAT repeat protein
VRKNTILILLAAVLIGVLAWQQTEIRSLRSELAHLAIVSERMLANSSSPEAPTVPAPAKHLDNGPLRQQLSAVEEQVRQLNAISEQLMERGAVPLSEARAAALKKRFLDSTEPDQERLRLLRILQRNRGIDDEVLQAGLAWVQTLSDPRLISEVLEQFIKLQSPALRDTALQLVTTHPDEHVRRRAAQILRGLEDAGIESIMWTALSSEQSREVQRELEDALRNIPVSATRKSELEGRLQNSAATFSERFTAFRVLVSAKAGNTESLATFANEVVERSDREQIADLFETLDNTGNLAAAPALISGLRLEDPQLRRSALDALGEMQTDPTVVEWLRHTATHDSDARVRGEAIRVLGQAGNKP